MAYTTIDKPNDYFNTVIYTGTGSSQSITGVGFQPDFVWTKQRSGTASHGFVDSVRGLDRYLASEQNIAEFSLSNNGLSSFDSDGFTVVSHAMYNASSSTYVSWNWLADNTSGSSNTDGSITSSVSVNTTSGISIGTFTGTGSNATVGHGLGAVPKYLWVKLRDSAGDWMVYHASNGNTKAMFYNSSNSGATSSTYWQDTTPTSSVFSIGSNGNLNTSGESHSFVAFAEKKGFSKFGSYSGVLSGGSTAVAAPFVYTGFKPAMVMTKCTNATENWHIMDATRSPRNGEVNFLYPNLSNSEDTYGSAFNGIVDFYSNGFGITYGTGGVGSSGKDYIYMAFAENPFVTSTGIPATAR